MNARITLKSVALCALGLASSWVHDGRYAQAQAQTGGGVQPDRSELQRWRHRDDLLTSLYFPLSHDPVRRTTLACLLVADEQWRDGGGSSAWPGIGEWFDAALRRSRRPSGVSHAAELGCLPPSPEGFVAKDGMLLLADRPIVEAAWFCPPADAKVGTLHACELNACLGFCLAVVEEVAAQERCCQSTLRTCGIGTTSVDVVSLTALGAPEPLSAGSAKDGRPLQRLTGFDEQWLPAWLRCRMSAQLFRPKAACAALDVTREQSVSRAVLWSMVLNGARVVYATENDGPLNPVTLENLAFSGFEWAQHAAVISRFPSRADIGVVFSQKGLAKGLPTVTTCVKTLSDHQIRFELLPLAQLDRDDLTDVLRLILLVDTDPVPDRSIKRLKQLQREGVYVVALSSAAPDGMKVDFHFAPKDMDRLIETVWNMQAKRLVMRDAVVPRAADDQPMPGVLSDSLQLDDGSRYVSLINLSNEVVRCRLITADQRVGDAFKDLLTDRLVGTGDGLIELKPQAVHIFKAEPRSP